MTSEQHERPSVVRIELTDEQKRQVAQAIGDARATSQNLALELTADELERRILPGVNLN